MTKDTGKATDVNLVSFKVSYVSVWDSVYQSLLVCVSNCGNMCQGPSVCFSVSV